MALHGEAKESLVNDVDAPSQRRFGDLIARQRERHMASDRSPTPEPEHICVDLDAPYAQRMAARAGLPASGPRQLPLIHVGMSAPVGP